MYIPLISLLFAFFLQKAEQPKIYLDAQRFMHGEIVSVNLFNCTKDTIIYYVDLDVFVKPYWGPADEDIMTQPISKSVKYSILHPGERRTIKYNTRNIENTYIERFSSYRFSLYYENKPEKYNSIIQSFNSAKNKVSTNIIKINQVKNYILKKQ